MKIKITICMETEYQKLRCSDGSGFAASLLAHGRRFVSACGLGGLRLK